MRHRLRIQVNRRSSKTAPAGTKGNPPISAYRGATLRALIPSLRGLDPEKKPGGPPSSFSAVLSKQRIQKLDSLMTRNAPPIEIEEIFNADELVMINLPLGQLTRERLLKQEGVWFLKDIAELLGITSTILKNECQKVSVYGENVWETVGARKIWNHWFIRMKVFAPYYRRHLHTFPHPIPKDLDPEAILALTGNYRLAQVAKRLGLSGNLLRYHAKKDPTVSGVEKRGQHYVVDMNTFASWLRTKKFWILRGL